VVEFPVVPGYVFVRSPFDRIDETGRVDGYIGPGVTAESMAVDLRRLGRAVEP
jgi:hypothetical protein